jgi:hypothetical protein
MESPNNGGIKMGMVVGKHAITNKTAFKPYESTIGLTLLKTDKSCSLRFSPPDNMDTRVCHL